MYIDLAEAHRSIMEGLGRYLQCCSTHLYSTVHQGMMPRHTSSIAPRLRSSSSRSRTGAGAGELCATISDDMTEKERVSPTKGGIRKSAILSRLSGPWEMHLQQPLPERDHAASAIMITSTWGILRSPFSPAPAVPPQETADYWAS